jgi:two-component sensor histidine kinase
MLGISEDITELKKALEEKDYLMKEINHRVKNNLMMITSLISLKNASLGEAVDLTDLKNQIDAIRIVHEKLYTTNKITNIDFKEYIDDLLNTIFFSFTERRVKVENKIEEITLTTKTAIPLGLIINEIATNAIQHGFSGTKEPLFKVEMVKTADGHGCKLKLSNNGRPFPDSV